MLIRSADSHMTLVALKFDFRQFRSAYSRYFVDLPGASEAKGRAQLDSLKVRRTSIERYFDRIFGTSVLKCNGKEITRAVVAELPAPQGIWRHRSELASTNRTSENGII
jgi:hypothetical protein